MGKVPTPKVPASLEALNTVRNDVVQRIFHRWVNLKAGRSRLLIVLAFDERKNYE